MIRKRYPRASLHFAVVTAVVMALLINPLTLLGGTVYAASTSSTMQAALQTPDTPPQPLTRAGVDLGNPQNLEATIQAKGSTPMVMARSAEEAAVYIVVLDGAPLASYRGGVANLAPTNQARQSGKKINSRSPESQAYLGYLQQEQAAFIDRANRTLGRPLDVLYTYRATLNGFAARMTAAEAQQIAKLSGVRLVEKEKIYELHTDAGPTWIGAPEIWGGELTALPFSAALSGANEVPPVTGPASGSATFQYNVKTQELSYEVTVADIENIIAAHIHRAPAGQNGGVAYDLYDGSAPFDPVNPISGVVTLSTADQALLMSGGLYVNVHTTASPSGAIRGQIASDGTLGEGVIVGVIDTGVDPWNPSFAATGDDGYTHENPLGEGTYLGVCDPTNTAPPSGVVAYDPTFPCNAKLIGVWGYSASDDNPRDTDGHGSHTASTAAGNVVKNPVVNTPTGAFTVELISGVAPHANVIMYDGCIDGGGCPGASLQAARDQALLDGVDVINYSIGSSSPTPDPYNEVEALSWLALRDAGVFVATSAGNAGPGDATVGSPADLPWITSVGANSHNRAFISTVTLNDGSTAPLTLTGMGLNTGFGPAPLVFAEDYVIPPATAEDARLCAPDAFPAGTFNGEIVICERGVYGRVAKGESAAAGGAGGFILAQPDEFGGGPGSITADTHVIPASHIDYYEYQKLLAYVTAAAGPVTAAISGGVLVVDNVYADIMASFSSRGPNGGLFDDIIVPSITAPGRSIWAAYHQGEGGDGDFTYNVIQGTSMASPHMAGAGALMKALYPDWSPAEIQSALMTTARTPITNDDGTNPATPFAEGAGEVDLTQAAHAALVLDVTTDEYLAADPAEGGAPKDLNLASMADNQCLLVCSWTRTVKSTLTGAESWTATATSASGLNITVSPSSFTLAPGATQEIVITADASSAPREEWLFGEVQLTPAGTAPAAHLPVAVMSTPGIIPAAVDIDTRRNAGSHLVTGLETIGISELTIETYGLVTGDKVELSLNEDPSNGDPYDNINDGTVSATVVNVPTGALSLAADIIASEAPDIDLYIGTGNTPSAATEVCVSASGTALESCKIDNPAAGEWWILVQNWDASSAPPDAITLAYAIVAGDAGNFWVEGPSSVAAGTPFDLRVYWDVPTMVAGESWYGAFTIGTDPANPGNIGTIFVNLNRLRDDVVKAVSEDEAQPGDTLTYQIVVDTNVTPEDLAYTLQDTIPAGLTYVDGSASATAGTVAVTGNTLTWTGTQPSANNFVGGYNITTNQNDAQCALPIGDGGYYDALTRTGFTSSAGITGDTISWSYGSHAGTDFYGTARAGSPRFTDDGIVVFGTYAGQPWVNQDIPNVNVPNGLLAPYWRDMEVVYDEATNKGVTAVTFGGGIFWLVEIDDIQPYDDPTQHLDLAIMSWNDIDPAAGSYDAYFAYDNVNIGDTIGTIGVENDAGDAATKFSFDNFTPTDGLVLCLDYVGLTPVVINYEVTVDADAAAGIVTNEVIHNTDNPGSKPATTSADVTINEQSCADVPNNLVDNGSFEEGQTGWRYYTNSAGSFTISDEAADCDSAAQIEVAAPGSNVQLYQKGIQLEANTAYRMTFMAYSSSGSDLGLYLHNHVAPYEKYGLAINQVNLTPGWERYTVEFNTKNFAGTVNNARLRFWLTPFASAGDTYVIDDVRLEKLDGSESDLSAVSAAVVGLGIDEAPVDPALLDLVDDGNVVDEGSEALRMFLPWVQR